MPFRAFSQAKFSSKFGLKFSFTNRISTLVLAWKKLLLLEICAHPHLCFWQNRLFCTASLKTCFSTDNRRVLCPWEAKAFLSSFFKYPTNYNVLVLGLESWVKKLAVTYPKATLHIFILSSPLILTRHFNNYLFPDTKKQIKTSWQCKLYQVAKKWLPGRWNI